MLRLQRLVLRPLRRGMWPGLVIVRCGLLWVATAASVVLLLTAVVMLRLLLLVSLVLWRPLVTGART